MSSDLVFQHTYLQYMCCESTRSFRRQVLRFTLTRLSIAQPGVSVSTGCADRVRRELHLHALCEPALPKFVGRILAVAPHGNRPAIEPTNTTCPLRIGPPRELPAGLSAGSRERVTYALPKQFTSILLHNVLQGSRKTFSVELELNET